MKSFAKILYKGNPHWVIKTSEENALLLHNSPFDKELIYSNINVNFLKDNIKYLPVSTPNIVVGLGRNYKDLVGEADVYEEPIFFLKSPTSVCGHQAIIPYPKKVEKVWVEVELVIVIGKKGKNIPPESAEGYILGYTIGSDITALNIHQRDWHLARSKALDDFAPVGPFLVKGLNTKSLTLKSYINGQVYQESNTSNRILNDSEVVSMISNFITLHPGDIIFTGTPTGATSSLVKPGDKVTHYIEGIGELSFSFSTNE